jgi:polysaccharide chain length determinant protein (PEP-CTERM system associated)
MSSELALIEHLDPLLLSEVRRKRGPLVVGFVVIALAALLVSAVWPEKYVASTTVLVKERSIITPLLEGRAVPTGVADLAGIAREVVFSRKVMDEVLKVGGWVDHNPSPLEREKLVEDIARRTTVASPRENLIQITYSDRDAKRAFHVTETLAAQFIKASIEAKENDSRDAFTFIENQVDEYRKRLTDAEDKIKQYRASHDDAAPGAETDTNTRIGQLRTQIESARMDYIEQSSRANALASQLSGENDMIVTQTREGDYYHRLGDLQTELDKLLLSYTDKHPDVIRTRHEIQDVQDELAREQKAAPPPSSAESNGGLPRNVRFNPMYLELHSKLNDAQRSMAVAGSRAGSAQSMLNQELERSKHITDISHTLAELNRDYEVQRDIYQDLLKRRENARVSMQMDEEHRGLTMTIQTPAQLPLQPAGPRFFYFAGSGLMFGLLIPLALLWSLLKFDPRLRGADQVARLAALPILATVPSYVGAPQIQQRRRETWRFVALLFAVLLAYIAVCVLHLVRIT